MISKKSIVYRIYIAAAFMLVFCILVAFKIMSIQTYNTEKYENIVSRNIRESRIQPVKGNLYSHDGTLLSTSITEYDVYVDLNTIKQSFFEENIDSLSDSLSVLFNKPPSYFKRDFIKEKKNKNQYKLLVRNLDFQKAQRLKKFPIFEKGPNKGGIIILDTIKRVRIYKSLGSRTIGFDDHRGRAGLEGAFSRYLSGKTGRRLEQKISTKGWKPLNIWNEAEPVDGKDVYTTIDMDIQNIAYNALSQQLIKFRADHGCVVIMEVSTGKMKAMVNLKRNKEGDYVDFRNWAVFEANEPGSTFKAATMLAALEDNYVQPENYVNVHGGKYVLYEKKILDTHPFGSITYAQAFAHSSNIAMAKIMMNYYQNHPDNFIRHLRLWKLDQPLDLPIPGEGMPYILTPDNHRWSRISLPWMGFGYNVKLTPMQLLAFYAGIANNGRMMQPYFIEKVVDKGHLVESYAPQVRVEHMASPKSIAQVNKMLQMVVSEGTAKGIRIDGYPLAGKTGTTQLNYKTGKQEYIASFAGFFPANKPQYACMVMVYQPDTSIGYYGAQVASPVFGDIAKAIYNRTPVLYKSSSVKVNSSHRTFRFNGSNTMPNLKSKWGDEVIPEMENAGFNLKYDGVGRVYQQVPKEGEPLSVGQTIYLKLGL